MSKIIRYSDQQPPRGNSKRKNRRYFRMVHIRETQEQLRLLSPPKGICFTVFNKLETKGLAEEGLYVAVYANDITPNDFEKRTMHDIDEFIAKNLTVIEDSPQGIKNWSGERKFETINNSEYVLKNAFDKKVEEISDQILKLENKKIEQDNEKLKSKPFNREDLKDPLVENKLTVYEI